MALYQLSYTPIWGQPSQQAVADRCEDSRIAGLPSSALARRDGRGAPRRCSRWCCRWVHWRLPIHRWPRGRACRTGCPSQRHQRQRSTRRHPRRGRKRSGSKRSSIREWQRSPRPMRCCWQLRVRTQEPLADHLKARSRSRLRPSASKTASRTCELCVAGSRTSAGVSSAFPRPTHHRER